MGGHGWDPLLVVVPLQLLQMLRQLLPFVRLDGYHILADLTGVPDLFARIKPIMRSFLPGRHRHDERVAGLKRWVRVVVTIWVLTVVPLLTFALIMMALTLPRLLSTAWDSLQRQWDVVTAAFAQGEETIGLAALISVFALILPAGGAVYMLIRTSRRTILGTWRRTDGRPAYRGLALTALVALAAGLAVLWWPNGKYQPIRADENWTMPQLVSQIPHAGTTRQAFAQAPLGQPGRPSGDPDAPPSSGEDGPPASGTPEGTPRSPEPTNPANANPAAPTPANGGAATFGHSNRDDRSPRGPRRPCGPRAEPDRIDECGTRADPSTHVGRARASRASADRRAGGPAAD